MPAVFELGLEAADQRVARFVKPKKVEVPQRDPEALEELGECLLSPLEAEWTTMLERGDVDAAWKYWRWTAEEVLLALSLPHLARADIDGRAPLPVAPATLSRGRGTGTLVRETSSKSKGARRRRSRWRASTQRRRPCRQCCGGCAGQTRGQGPRPARCCVPGRQPGAGCGECGKWGRRLQPYRRWRSTCPCRERGPSREQWRP